MKFSKYYLSAITAYLIWGFFSLGLKPLANFASLDILFYRVFLCVILMVAINVFFRKKVIKETYSEFKSLEKKEKNSIIFLIISGTFLLTANWFFFIYVMNHINVKAAGFAYLVCPILTAVFASIILKEKLSALQKIAVAISFFSCMMLAMSHLKDVIYSLIVGATYALYLVSQRKNTRIDKFLMLGIQLFGMACILLPFYPIYSQPFPTETNFFIFIPIISVLFTIIPMYLSLYALKGVNSSTVGILIYINPIINFFLAVFLFHEKISETQIIAYTLIMIAVAIFNYSVFAKRKTVALKM